MESREIARIFKNYSIFKRFDISIIRKDQIPRDIFPNKIFLIHSSTTRSPVNKKNWIIGHFTVLDSLTNGGRYSLTYFDSFGNKYPSVETGNIIRTNI